MKVGITGSTGLIGEALVSALEAGGHSVVRLVRRAPGAGEVAWDPERGKIDTTALAGIDAAVNLAGDSIAAGRWNPAKKKRIFDSRVKGTRLFCETLAELKPKPKTLVSASAIGYYGDRGSQVLRETDAPGNDFLAKVCREWEAATMPAADRGIRVVMPRFGAVLAREGGALAKMLTPFKLGLGGKIGSGGQYMSWISLEDAVRVLLFALENENLDGPVNATAPQAVTNAVFTRTLGRELGRPTILPMPAFAARLAFGEMADALLLSSARVQPERLEQEGFKFKHASLESALKDILA